METTPGRIPDLVRYLVSISVEPRDVLNDRILSFSKSLYMDLINDRVRGVLRGQSSDDPNDRHANPRRSG
jgi:hypothetical protein